MKTRTVQGLTGYGSKPSPTEIYVAETKNGASWYVTDGGTMVNKTFDEIKDGTWAEELNDVDVFTWNKPITSEEELLEAIES